MSNEAQAVQGIPLWQVEHELNRAFSALQGPGEAPQLRARLSNLVVYCDSPQSGLAIDAQLPAIVAVHPARVLLIIKDDSQESDLTASVTVRPLSIGERRQVVCEQVTLRGGSGLGDRAPFAVRELLIGDLPMNIWWAAPVPPPFAGTLLYELGEGAQQIMFDSLDWPDPIRGVSATANWLDQIERPQAGRWRVASDLNWRRLKYWRRSLAQALDSLGVEPSGVCNEVLVTHGPSAVVQAWELASWLMARLGWKVQGGKVLVNEELSWRCVGPNGDGVVRVRRLDSGPHEIQSLRVSCTLGGTKATLCLKVEDSQRVAVTLEGTDSAPRTMAMPAHSPAEIVGRQLSDRDRDPVFHESMAVAQKMAQCVLH
jgi:glucose-6-phosphate dehydrogenase assembly protein OpcA